MKRTIAVVTTSRADYSHLYWPMYDLRAHPDVELKIIVMGSHLSPEFGMTVGEIEKDGFAIAARIECLLSSDTDVGMAKTIGLATLSLADLLGTMRPDLLLLIADRYEMLAPAAVALALRIPIAHIEGGEISEGAIDDAVRNALTKMSHIHFTSTYGARARVISMGEEAWRVHRAGAPSLDHLERRPLLCPIEVEQRLGVNLAQPTLLVAYHPVTLSRDTTVEADALFAALESIDGQILFCYPNADAGSRNLIERTRGFLRRRGSGQVFTNMGAVTYWSLLRHVDALAGNSSSGIMETASFALPTVNIGMRQQGRERARNVIDAAPDATSIRNAILKACSPAFRLSLAGMTNPYGEGVASRKIVEVLTTVSLDAALLVKHVHGAAPVEAPVGIPLSAPEIADADIDAVVNVLRGSRLSLGPVLADFERFTADYVGAAHAVAVNSGTSGLHLALLALGIGAGDEVIVPSFTFVAAANVIRYVGALPVFIDIEPLTLNLDPTRIEAAITPQTRAILVVHTFGIPAEMSAILEIARRHKLRVIEDACEALGAEYRGKKVGPLGDAGVFAFYPNKQITTGEGGMLVTNDAEIAATGRSLRNQGRRDTDDWFQHSELGYNYRISEINCALGLEQMKRIESILVRREHVAAQYGKLLHEDSRLILPAPAPLNRRVSWFVYVLRLGRQFTQVDRDGVRKHLAAAGIASGRYFAPIHLQPAYRSFSGCSANLPVTESESARCIALPFHNRLSDLEVERVCDHLLRSLERR